MYLLKCFDSSDNEFQVQGATQKDVFAAALAGGALRAIDWNGWVYTLKNGSLVWGGVSLWTHLAGTRAGSQNFSLINPPK